MIDIRRIDKRQIRTIFLYEFKLGHSATAAVGNINRAFGHETTSVRTAQVWFKRFREGDDDLEDKEGRGRPRLIDDDDLRQVIEADPRTTEPELAKHFNVGISTIGDHLRYIGKVKKLEKRIPHQLSDRQKFTRFLVASSL